MCGCNKRNPNPWSPRSKKATPANAASGGGARIVSDAERRQEQQNASRPPRAPQPQA